MKGKGEVKGGKGERKGKEGMGEEGKGKGISHTSVDLDPPLVHAPYHVISK